MPACLQIYFPQRTHGASINSIKGYLIVYLRGEPMRRWKECSCEERQEKSLAAVERLFPRADVQGLLEEVHDQWWDEDGSGAYYLSGAPRLIPSLRPVGQCVFSPVPRGWVDDALVDGRDAVSDVLRLLQT